jgi:hypothetical protein
MRSRSGPCACAGGLPRSLVDPRKTSPVVSVDASLQPGKKLLCPYLARKERFVAPTCPYMSQSRVNP